MNIVKQPTDVYCRAGTIEEPKIYGDLCTILEKDDYFDLKLYMPSIYGINLYLINHKIDKKIETYRGSHINDKQFNFIKEGGIYQITKFLATSSDIRVAKRFVTESMVLVTFNIPANYTNAAHLNKYSYFGEEEAEVLVTPYSGIKIIKIDKNDKKIFVEMLENNMIDKNTPQIHL